MQYTTRLFLGLVIAAGFWAVGCDDRNVADLPFQPYELKAVYPTPGLAADVSVGNSIVAVADEYLGVHVLDASNPADITELYRFTDEDGARCTDVFIDPLHQHLAMRFNVNTDLLGQFPLVDYRISDPEESYLTWIGMSGPFGAFEMEIVQDTLTFWGSDQSIGDGLNVFRLCRDNDTSNWTMCDFPWNNWSPRDPEGAHGFDINGDGLLAIASEQEGVYIHPTRPQAEPYNFDTPGLAYDCMWHGNYLIIADEFSVVIADASDPANGSIVTSLSIDGATRLRQVEIDGDYAAVLDDYDGIYILDISTIAEPEFIQLIELEGPTSIDAESGRLYVTDEVAGLVIYSRE
jgi:hypothetical protein